MIESNVKFMLMYEFRACDKGMNLWHARKGALHRTCINLPLSQPDCIALYIAKRIGSQFHLKTNDLNIGAHRLHLELNVGWPDLVASSKRTPKPESRVFRFGSKNGH